MHRLNTKTLGNLPVAIPEMAEQSLIVESINPLESQLTKETLMLSKLISLKSGLQDDLLTGQFRVPETIREGAAGL